MADDVHRAGAVGEGVRSQASQGYGVGGGVRRQALEDGEPDSGYYLGELLIELDRSGEAVPILREAVDGGDPDALIPLGNALWDQGDLAGAEASYRQAAD